MRGWLARRMHVCPDDVEDVVHETFLRASELANEFDPGRGTVAAWLHGLVAARAWTDHQRHYRFRNHAGADAAADVHRRGPVESTEERESRPLSRRVVTALARLTPARRRAVQLRYLEGLSETAAAQVTGSHQYVYQIPLGQHGPPSTFDQAAPAGDGPPRGHQQDRPGRPGPAAAIEQARQAVARISAARASDLTRLASRRNRDHARGHMARDERASGSREQLEVSA